MTSTVDRLRFTASLGPVVVLVAFVCAVATASALAHGALLGPDPETYPPHLMALLSLPFSVAVLLGTWAVLRHEGVSPAAVGLGRSTLGPGVVAFGLFWVVVAVGGVAVLLVTGATDRLGRSFGRPWYWTAVWALLTLTVSNGLTEEFVFRGYVQSKCTALAATTSRVPATAGGILAGAVLFGVVHVPLGVVLYDISLPAVPFIVLNNALPGVLFGLGYYLTQNVWYTGLVHGFANATVVPFEPAAVPLFRAAAGLVALLVALGYRRWAAASQRVTVARQKEVASVTE